MFARNSCAASLSCAAHCFSSIAQTWEDSGYLAVKGLRLGFSVGGLIGHRDRTDWFVLAVLRGSRRRELGFLLEQLSQSMLWLLSFL